jgi:hypothetical protein
MAQAEDSEAERNTCVYSVRKGLAALLEELDLDK